VVGATERTPEAILQALRSGLFYSSCGPRFESIELHGRSVWCRTSPVSFARLVGPRHHGRRVGSFDGKTMTMVELEIPDDFAYARLEIEDAAGRRAWTNGLFCSADAA
jgi:hypothetical protein